jgi:hypothetical protein
LNLRQCQSGVWLGHDCQRSNVGNLLEIAVAIIVFTKLGEENTADLKSPRVGVWITRNLEVSCASDDLAVYGTRNFGEGQLNHD